jgi:RNA polymerase sporulation-specific sigma factor
MVEKISLRQAVETLEQRESMVIRLRYFHGLTQDKVSQIMNVSQVQVSRIEKKALAHLRQRMDS